YGAVDLLDEGTGQEFKVNGQRLKHYWGDDSRYRVRKVRHALILMRRGKSGTTVSSQLLPVKVSGKVSEVASGKAGDKQVCHLSDNYCCVRRVTYTRQLTQSLPFA
ncbi:hypothetical protein A2U01_0026733, partial [Trifolium medium]|nr:hypothetical protein [Trifolium medium]